MKHLASNGGDSGIVIALLKCNSNQNFMWLLIFQPAWEERQT